MASEQTPDDDSLDGSNTDDILAMEANQFQAAFGESVENPLDIDTWQLGDDLAAMYTALEQQVAQAVEQEGRIRERIRSELFPAVFTHPQAPQQAGCYKVEVAQLERIHRGLLFNGGVEACDGTSLVHDTLPITIAQIGVSLVSYHGDQGTWVHRLFRRDLRVSGLDPIDEAMALLERRRKRDSTDVQSTRDRLSDFTQRGIMAYAERAILLHKSQAPWRMGHGHPVPYELLTGGGLVIDGDMPLLRQSMQIWHELLVEHKRWVFVTGAPSQALVRIRSVPDSRKYLGIVIKGPFAEPDGLRGDAPIMITTAVRGGIFMPRYHGRVQVELLGEELGEVIIPPRLRPLPNSPVFVLDTEETSRTLRLGGDIPP